MSEKKQRNTSPETIKKRAASRYIDAKAACDKANLRRQHADDAHQDACSVLKDATAECVRLGVPFSAVAEKGEEKP